MSKRDPNILTPDELADRLGVPKSAILTMAREGRIPAMKIGKTWRFSYVAVVRAIEGNFADGGEQPQRGPAKLNHPPSIPNLLRMPLSKILSQN